MVFGLSQPVHGSFQFWNPFIDVMAGPAVAELTLLIHKRVLINHIIVVARRIGTGKTNLALMLRFLRTIRPPFTCLVRQNRSRVKHRPFMQLVKK